MKVPLGKIPPRFSDLYCLYLHIKVRKLYTIVSALPLVNKLNCRVLNLVHSL